MSLGKLSPHSQQHVGSHVSKCDVLTQGHDQPIDYESIRQMCASDDITDHTMVAPRYFSHDRKRNWPEINKSGMGPDISKIYESVKCTGLPNALGTRVQLPTKLNIANWERFLDKSDDHQELLQFIKYGFPLGYLGPPSNSTNTPNHTSALSHELDVDKFLTKEIELGGIIGPMHQYPFSQWLHLSPLMTRAKKGSTNRRVITDMTFPNEKSVNAFIIKNMVNGTQRQHALPTVDEFVEQLGALGPGSYMSSTDVSRAL